MVLKQSSRVEPLKSTIPATLTEQGVVVFWLAVLLTGIGAGISAAVLTLILQWVQHVAWPGPGGTLLDSVEQAGPWRHIAVLVVAGLITGAGQLALVRLTSANGIEITSAIWFNAGRLPALRTLGSAVLSTIIVALGASLGREGAPLHTQRQARAQRTADRSEIFNRSKFSLCSRVKRDSGLKESECRTLIDL